MKLTALLFTIFMSLTACTTQKVESQKIEVQKETKSEVRKPQNENQAKNYVIVELFTSEGCSSCPPADKVLARLQKEQPVENVEIIPLALHVDYWDYLGWKDKFSSADYSARQTGYADKFKLDAIYTPQMVVDGQTQFTGSQFDTAVNSVKESANSKKAGVELAIENNNLKVDISDLPKHDAAYVWFVITEDNLQTDVKRGENLGRKLPHTAVVREMKLLDTLAENASNFSGSQAIALETGWEKKNLNLIIFVQGKNSKTIYAVGKKQLV
ncbi:MAG: DUF1223 domain-containing protein [Pyrinomonadaceae bacterium]